MQRHLVLLPALFLLAGFAFAAPAGLASSPSDQGPTLRLYLPLVERPPEPPPTPAETQTLTPSATPTETQTPTPSPTATETAPVTPSATPTGTPTPSPTRDPNPIEWDPRLEQRGVLIVLAQVRPGQWYWRLVKGVWYAENEWPFAGQHHIFVDARTASDERKAGVPFKVTSLDGGTVFQTIWTEMKPPNEYAANFPMYAVAPAYRAIPADGNPGDAVSNLGMGTIEEPWRAAHTSYGFTWQWSQATEMTMRPEVGPAVPRPTWWLGPLQAPLDGR